MCGIFASYSLTHTSDTQDILLKALERLEYRGYDSAGICMEVKGELKVHKICGKVSQLIKSIKSKDHANIGMAHTRWATHGSPCINNAHPILSSSNKFALVHNGIISNYSDIKEYLLSKGIQFKGETDSECVIQLVEYIYSSLRFKMQNPLSKWVSNVIKLFLIPKEKLLS